MHDWILSNKDIFRGQHVANTTGAIESLQTLVQDLHTIHQFIDDEHIRERYIQDKHDAASRTDPNNPGNPNYTPEEWKHLCKGIDRDRFLNDTR